MTLLGKEYKSRKVGEKGDCFVLKMLERPNLLDSKLSVSFFKKIDFGQEKGVRSLLFYA